MVSKPLSAEILTQFFISYYEITDAWPHMCTYNLALCSTTLENRMTLIATQLLANVFSFLHFKSQLSFYPVTTKKACHEYIHIKLQSVGGINFKHL